jgi:hypothetical protein
MKQVTVEQYVGPDEAAEFLKVKRLKMIRLARSGEVPAHPLGTGSAVNGGSSFLSLIDICMVR